MSTWLPTIITGVISIIINIVGVLVMAYMPRPIATGIASGSIVKRFFSGLEGMAPSGLNVRSVTSTGLYGVRRNGTWPS